MTEWRETSFGSSYRLMKLGLLCNRKNQLHVSAEKSTHKMLIKVLNINTPPLFSCWVVTVMLIISFSLSWKYTISRSLCYVSFYTKPNSTYIKFKVSLPSAFTSYLYLICQNLHVKTLFKCLALEVLSKFRIEQKCQIWKKRPPESSA